MFFRSFCTLSLLLTPAPLLAQAVVQPLSLSDADALAEQVRRLGANPLDVDALLTAADLSVRLDDLSAAGAFLARAEKVMPVGARGAAIRGEILVRSERPGEALRQFAQAEAQGLAPARFAADRGLAYDLTGEQRRAQADYRLALKSGDSDEVRRRLALSLGIAGKNREALDELAPLVRRNDRGAWRARAFILAMSGDAPEALKIAQTMMPPGSAQGLQGFFAELPRLPAIDRAFAVHFGEVRPTPQRLADARLAPPLAALPPEAAAPVQVATIMPAPATQQKGKRGKPRVGRVALPEAAPAPTQVAVIEPVTQPPAYQAPVYQQPAYQPPLRTPAIVASNTADRPLTPGEQASLAAATLRSARGRTRTTPAPTLGTMPSISRPVAVATVAPRLAPTVTSQRPIEVAALAARPSSPPAVAGTTTSAMPAGRTAPSAVGAPLPTPGFTLTSNALVLPPSAASGSTIALPSPSALPVAGPPAPAALTTPSASAPVLATAANTVTETGPAPLEAAPQPVATSVAPVSEPVRVAATPPARISRARADDILAKIVANLSIPASELGIDRPPPGAKRSRAAERLAATTPDEDEKPTAAERRAADKKALAAKKAAADKILADKKAAAEKKALADKAAAEKKAARAEPSRIWVQVAGGANEGGLAKAWKAVRAKAPGALAGKQGYTTPLRATNRVLTGPFRTDAEARAYVNQLAKSGVSAFSFTSEAGQKVSRLETK